MSTHLTPTHTLPEQITEGKTSALRWLVSASGQGDGAEETFVVTGRNAADALLEANFSLLGRDLVEDRMVGTVHHGKFTRVALLGPIIAGAERDYLPLTLRERAEAEIEVASIVESSRRERQERERETEERDELDELMRSVFGEQADFRVERTEVWGTLRSVAWIKWDAQIVLSLIVGGAAGGVNQNLRLIEFCARCRWHEASGPIGRLTDICREPNDRLYGRHRCDAERLAALEEAKLSAEGATPFWRMEEIFFADGLCFRFTNRHGDSFDLDNQRIPYVSRLGDTLTVTAASMLERDS